MPEISRFYGIVIQIYYGDHQPPHFHVNYAGQVAKIDIDTLALIDGSLPARARGLVTEAYTKTNCGKPSARRPRSKSHRKSLPFPKRDGIRR
jgi:hypothetical protein